MPMVPAENFNSTSLCSYNFKMLHNHLPPAWCTSHCLASLITSRSQEQSAK
ncbi:uncharacterized protein EKO05_0007543 [Ascochyta rabiei]|uniref:uncharacterized protein n=1 Tax=Didymella rabiei TaxID=5454 RepID=UPI0021FD3D9A|nr:uncharacterized protein EKO05_0007543 [Ascochyta rabiei]UPX17171.1 hypothetical protein EKO05_0007543 [Ascochyta rabiei]